jgi:lactate dehydrogenase-like 2-hydroxyacid dehydrogenase
MWGLPADMPSLRAIASCSTLLKIDGALMSKLPKLEIVSSFGVGYDHVDAKWAGQNGIVVTMAAATARCSSPPAATTTTSR